MKPPPERHDRAQPQRWAIRATNSSNLIRFAWLSLNRCWQFALALFLFDWAWGMAQVRGIVPLWSFLLLNFPFAWPYVWLESHWRGTHYSVAGQTISEWWSLASFLLMVVAQAVLYRALWHALFVGKKKPGGDSS